MAKNDKGKRSIKVGLYACKIAFYDDISVREPHVRIDFFETVIFFWTIRPSVVRTRTCTANLCKSRRSKAIPHGDRARMRVIYELNDELEW